MHCSLFGYCLWQISSFIFLSFYLNFEALTVYSFSPGLSCVSRHIFFLSPLTGKTELKDSHRKDSLLPQPPTQVFHFIFHSFIHISLGKRLDKLFFFLAFLLRSQRRGGKSWHPRLLFQVSITKKAKRKKKYSPSSLKIMLEQNLNTLRECGSWKSDRSCTIKICPPFWKVLVSLFKPQTSLIKMFYWYHTRWPHDDITKQLIMQRSLTGSPTLFT